MYSSSLLPAMSSHQIWRRAKALHPKAGDSSMPLGRSRITARDLGWAGPWATQSQTLFIKIAAAKQYASHCKDFRYE